MPSNARPAQPRRLHVPSVIGHLAMVVQLTLAIAVGVIVVRAIAYDPAGAAPWALAYLAWCATILRQLAARVPTGR